MSITAPAESVPRVDSNRRRSAHRAEKGSPYRLDSGVGRRTVLTFPLLPPPQKN